MTTKLDDAGIRRRQDGSIDTDFYLDRALTLRAAAACEQKTGFARRLVLMVASPFAARRWPARRSPGVSA